MKKILFNVFIMMQVIFLTASFVEFEDKDGAEAFLSAEYEDASTSSDSMGSDESDDSHVTLTYEIDDERSDLGSLYSFGDHDWSSVEGVAQQAKAKLLRRDILKYSLKELVTKYKNLFSKQQVTDMWFKVRMMNLLEHIGYDWPTYDQYSYFYELYTSMPEYLQDHTDIAGMKRWMDENAEYYAVDEDAVEAQ